MSESAGDIRLAADEAIRSALLGRGLKIETLGCVSGESAEPPETGGLPWSDECHAAAADFIGSSPEVLLIVNDTQRPTPTPRILNVIGPLFEGKRVRVIVASGTHCHDLQGLGYILGPAAGEKNPWGAASFEVEFHDCRERGRFADLGKSARGTPYLIDRRVLEFPKVIVVGSVEPHYFAGFTGGRKGFLPGVSAYETIEANHSHAMNPSARALALDGNPVHEDMDGLLDRIDLDRVLGIMAVADSSRSIVFCRAGGIREAFCSAIEPALKLWTRPCSGLFDLVVTIARPPFDRTLYQAQKALENGRLALRPGGTVILVAPMENGTGDQGFYNMLCSKSTPEGVLRASMGKYVLGNHKAARLAALAAENRVLAVTTLDKAICKGAFIESFTRFDDAFTAAVRGETKKCPTALLIPDGSSMIPLVSQS